ncbi:hypothetical protein TSAR_005284 [Trichomalopsis sarcophagae]|uniref:Reverse transcriptase domain-containing protein n=1 Tax=Trichomalopsis sarcophagae TaxID=543379 RepID=A0A232F6H2_9HYME|nr:hypothetical protein TSAR_005284 [Trichomalopsis sarcophagae]
MELGLCPSSSDNAPLTVPVDSLNDYFVGSSSPQRLQLKLQGDEARDLIAALASAHSNAQDTDCIPIKFIKETFSTIYSVLLNIFDASLQSGIFPSCWKTAVVRPLAEKSAPEYAEDYRPISILPALSKLLEFVAYDQIDPLQSGFRKSLSTHTAVIKIVDDIRCNINGGDIILLASIDFRQAFDTVNIDLLCQKLVYYGFSDSDIGWIRSFLTERSQVETHDLVTRLNNYLRKIKIWGYDNGLLINANKTHTMWLGSRGFISRLPVLYLPNIEVNCAIIEPCDSLKILGIVLDSTLSWREQTSATAKKCFAALSRLSKCGDSLPNRTKFMLIKALIFPYFDYCASIFLNLSDELNTKLAR